VNQIKDIIQTDI